MSYFETLCSWAPLTPHYVVTGRGTTDLQIIDEGGRGVRAMPLLTRLIDICRLSGLEYVVVADPAQGLLLRDLRESPAAETPALPGFLKGFPPLQPMPCLTEPWQDPVGDLEAVIRNVAVSEVLGGVIVVDAGRIVTRRDSLTEPEHNLFTAAAGTARLAYPRQSRTQPSVFSPVYWICESERDLPAWYLTNPRVRTVTVSEPTRFQRERLASVELPGREEEIARDTDSFTTSETRDVMGLVAAGVTVKQASTTVRIGTTTDYWVDRSLWERLPSAEAEFSREVIGQPAATRLMADRLSMAATGLSGIHLSANSYRPRFGCILCGPTGVGKTELAKVTHRFVFGSGTPTTLDMSSYNNEESRQRLTGAPPGYVGYENGGELTNAVSERPYQFLLFDEVEKMHPSNWDIFIQILAEGRLTDGLGRTTYFDQTAIIFTSNLGMTEVVTNGFGERVSRPKFDLDSSYEEIHASVTASVEEYFDSLKRPEILGRIGMENIVVYDLLRPGVASQIFDKMIGTARSNFKERWNADLEFEEDAYEVLRRACCTDLSLGGRGIGNAIEHSLNNPLGRFLVGHLDSLSSVIRVTSWSNDDGVPSLVVAK